MEDNSEAFLENSRENLQELESTTALQICLATYEIASKNILAHVALTLLSISGISFPLSFFKNFSYPSALFVFMLFFATTYNKIRRRTRLFKVAANL
jgi:hypothetical protein